MLSDEDKVVLRDLAIRARAAQVGFFVIGAGARLLAYDWPLQVIGGRATTDWDIAVRVASWDEFERLKDALTAEGTAFRRTQADLPDAPLRPLQSLLAELVSHGSQAVDDLVRGAIDQARERDIVVRRYAAFRVGLS
jgi:predicted nucleotidyltransferase